MSGTALRRLYFALWPDEPQRAAVVRAAAGAVARAGGRAVPAANLHLTLVFLGELAPERVAAAVAAARATAAALHEARAAPAEQPFGRVATWGRGGPLVLEAERTAPALHALRAGLANALVAADFQLDRREFRPHITLARSPERHPEPERVELVWRFRNFVLVESRPGPNGSEYEVVETFALR